MNALLLALQFLAYVYGPAHFLLVVLVIALLLSFFPGERIEGGPPYRPVLGYYPGGGLLLLIIVLAFFL